MTLIRCYHSEPEWTLGDGNEGVLHIPQSSSITGTSPSDCLVSYPGLTLLQRRSRCILQHQPTEQSDTVRYQINCVTKIQQNFWLPKYFLKLRFLSVCLGYRTTHGICYDLKSADWWEKKLGGAEKKGEIDSLAKISTKVENFQYFCHNLETGGEIYRSINYDLLMPKDAIFELSTIFFSWAVDVCVCVCG